MFTFSHRLKANYAAMESSAVSGGAGCGLTLGLIVAESGRDKYVLIGRAALMMISSFEQFHVCCHKELFHLF